MKQGEIWNVDLNPTKGSEQRGIRPVVIISGNLVNESLSVIIACPLTSKVKKIRGNVLLSPNKTSGLKKESEVLIFHVRSISKARFKKRMGKIKEDQLETIKQNLNKLLDY